MNEATVLVTGAAGFIGRHVVTALVAAGWNVRALVRRPLPPSPGVECFVGDMRDEGSLARAATSCSAVVHLAAATSDQADSEDVNVRGARRLVQACRGAACRRLVVVSTQSAKIARKGIYAATKASADELLLRSGLDVTILLPSIVYGDHDAGIFGTLHRIVTTHRIVPVLGDGRWHSAPVHVDDVVAALVACLDRPQSVGRCYDIGGPDRLAFDDLLDRIAAATGVSAPRKIHVPFTLALGLARLLSAAMQRPPLTVSNVLGSNQDTTLDIAAARADLGFDPMPLAEGLRRMFPDPALERLQDELRREAHRLGRYLVRGGADTASVERYVQAHLRLLPAEPDRVTAFARRHPAAIPFLDAAAALEGIEPPWRKRVLLMASILEAMPLHASLFLPARAHPVVLVIRLVGHGLLALGRAAVGAPLYLVLRRKV